MTKVKAEKAKTVKETKKVEKTVIVKQMRDAITEEMEQHIASRTKKSKGGK